MWMPAQAFAQLLDMRHVKDLGRGGIAEIEAVIAVTHRMPLEAGEGNKASVLIGGVGRPQILCPGGARPLKTLAMIIDQVAQARVVLRHVVPVAVQGDAGEIQLQAGVEESVGEAARSIAQIAVIMNIAVVDFLFAVGG